MNNTLESYQTVCYACGAKASLLMLAFRNKDDKLAGWIFVCSNCIGKFYEKELKIELVDREVL